jgi:type I restriction enzyme S subunit
MKRIKLEELIRTKVNSLDPSKYPETKFNLCSISAFDKGKPEELFGKEIGSSKKILIKGDVVISRIVPHIKRVWEIPVENENIVLGSGEWIVFNSPKYFDGYLRHFLQTEIFHKQFMSTVKGVGGSLLRADPKQTGKIEIPLPPLETQQKIAAILDAADAYRQKTKTLIEKYDQLAQSLFLDMFGDPVRNERGWKTKFLEDICDVGSSRRVFVNELVDSGIPFYRGTEVGKLGNDENINPSLFITKEHYENLKTQTGVPKVGDLLMPSICPDGRIFRVVNEEPFYFKDGRVLWIKVNESNINSIYLKAILKVSFQSNYASIASGTTFAELKIIALKKIEILYPPITLQNQFAERIQLIEAQKQQAQTSLKKAEDLFNSLLQRAFKGELVS